MIFLYGSDDNFFNGFLLTHDVTILTDESVVEQIEGAKISKLIVIGQSQKRLIDKKFGCKLANRTYTLVNGVKIYYFSYSSYLTKDGKVSGWKKPNTTQTVITTYTDAFTYAIFDCQGLRIESVPYITVCDENTDEVIAALEQEDTLIYDTETFNTEIEREDFVKDKYINPRSKGFNVRLLGFGISGGVRYILPLHTKDSCPMPVDSTLSLENQERILAAFKSYLLDESKTIVGHNIKYDIAVTSRVIGVSVYDIKCTIMDTMVLYYIYNCDFTLRELSLKALITRVYPKLTNYEDGLHHKYDNKRVWRYATYEDLSTYLGLDLAATEILYYYIMQILSSPDNREMLYHYKQYQQKALKITSHIESNGLPIDPDTVRLFITYVDRIYNWALEKLNTDNTTRAYRNKLIQEAKDKSKLEFDPMANNTIKGLISFATGKKYDGDIDEFNLSKLYKPKYQFLKYYVLAKKLNKTLNTYLRNFLDAEESIYNNRLHANLNMMITRTGRLSGSNPNLTNLSDWMRVKNPLVKKCTKTIKRTITHTGDFAEGQSKERVIVEGDFKAVELVMAAFLSNDRQLQEVFVRDEDPHALTAKKVKGISDDAWDAMGKHEKKAIRTNVGKFYNFSTIFRITPNGLVYRAEMAGVKLDRKKAEEDIEAFFALYPNLRFWQNNVINYVKKTNYVNTMFGFRRPMRGYHQAIQEGNTHEYEKRIVNTPIQGSAGQYMVYTLNQVKEELDKTGLSEYASIINTVHDSGWFSIDSRPEILQKVLKLIKDVAERIAMERLEKEFNIQIPRFVPIKMEFDIGFNAADFVEIGDDLSIGRLTEAISIARKAHKEAIFHSIEDDMAEFVENVNELL